MTTSNSAFRAVFKAVDSIPVETTISTYWDICDLLGRSEFKITHIAEDTIAISRTDAYDYDEPSSVTYSYDDGNFVHTEHIYGDVIIVGYDPELDETVSLNSYQLSRWLFTPGDLD